MLSAALLAAVLGYAGVVLAFWALQDRLVFYPQPLAAAAQAPPGWRLEAIRETARDGTALEGVLVLPPGRPRPLVVYYGGNAEEITSMAATADARYGERALLLVNYRGYGTSAGRPGERALVDDARDLLERATARTDVDGTRIALHGRSLGSGVAVQVAARHRVKCVVLTSPFDSARAVASRLYPWLPVRALLRHPFDSAAVAGTVAAPALFLVGEVDTLVSPDHSLALARAWGAAAQWSVLPGRGHGDVSADESYARHVRDFLDRHH